MKPEPTRFLPLSPAALHILLALAGEDLHGYGIMQEIARQSAGQYKLGPGTLYDNLKKLILHGLIEQALPLEVERLDGVLREARSHLRAFHPRRT
jgi:DNA-binding MarR family transcriptional regulator